MAHLPQSMTTNQVSALINSAADIDLGSTFDTYTLEASPGQTVVITAVHTILTRRVPAPRATEVEVVPTCSAQPALFFNLVIDLDGSNLLPKITTLDPDDPNRTISLIGLQATVTSDSPVVIKLRASTNKYDGRSKQALIENGSRPFHTMAVRSDDAGLIVTFNYRKNIWNVTKGSPGQMNSG